MIYSPGTVITQPVTYRDSTGAVVDPSSPYTVITPPSGPTVTVVPTRIGLGQYTWSWTVPLSPAIGSYSYIDYGTIQAVLIQSDMQVFTVVASGGSISSGCSPGRTATLTFDALRDMAQVCMSQWCILTVKDEVLTPADNVGTEYVSFWDNWLVPPASYALEPMVTMGGIYLTRGTDYTLTTSGDAVRAVLQMANPQGSGTIVLATYRRAMLADQFWQNILFQAIQEVTQRLLMNTVLPVDLNSITMNPVTDPWHIVVKMASKLALINLQTFMAGLGKVQIENVVTDLSRAHTMIDRVVTEVSTDIDKMILSWRWKKTPAPRSVAIIRGPFGIGSMNAGSRGF